MTINPSLSATFFNPIYDVVRFSSSTPDNIPSSLEPLLAASTAKVKGWACSNKTATTDIKHYGFLTTPLCGIGVSPDVLLMDEPCSALDPTSTRRIEETIAEIQNQVTIVIVTHNMQQAQRVSQDCAFFLAAEGTPGHIVESGPTERMFEAPVDPRTADYVHGRFG